MRRCFSHPPDAPLNLRGSILCLGVSPRFSRAATITQKCSSLKTPRRASPCLSKSPSPWFAVRPRHAHGIRPCAPTTRNRCELCADECLKTDHPEKCTHKLAEYTHCSSSPLPYVITHFVPYSNTVVERAQDASLAVLSEDGSRSQSPCRGSGACVRACAHPHTQGGADVCTHSCHPFDSQAMLYAVLERSVVARDLPTPLISMPPCHAQAARVDGYCVRFNKQGV